MYVYVCMYVYVYIYIYIHLISYICHRKRGTYEAGGKTDQEEAEGRQVPRGPALLPPRAAPPHPHVSFSSAPVRRIRALWVHAGAGAGAGAGAASSTLDGRKKAGICEKRVVAAPASRTLERDTPHLEQQAIGGSKPREMHVVLKPRLLTGGNASRVFTRPRCDGARGRGYGKEARDEEMAALAPPCAALQHRTRQRLATGRHWVATGASGEVFLCVRAASPSHP